MRDQRRVIRQLRPRTGSYRLGFQPRLTLGLQRRQGTHKIRWKVVRLRYHEAIESDQAAKAKKQTVKRLSDPCRTMGFLRVAPIDSRQKVAHLRRRDRHCFARNRWPDEPSSLESLGEQACSLAIVPDHLHKIASATAEDEQMTAERVFTQHLLHLERQRRKASAHVRVACRQPHSRTRRNRDHRRTKASRTRRSASPSTSPSTRMRCPLPRSISMMPWLFRRRAAVVVCGASATSRGGTDGPISTGTNGAALASPSLLSSLRHLNSWLT